MLGTIGFTVAAFAFVAYGYTSYQLALRNPSYNRDSFLIAYILIAFACLMWAVGIHLVSDQLMFMVLLGDALLLIASAFLFAPSVKKASQPLVLGGGAVLTALLLVLRIQSSDTDAFVRGGVLVFNTPRLFGAILALILLAVWVKANMYFFSHVVDKNIQAAIRPAYFSSNLFAYIGVIGFLFSRKNITITASFIMIVAAFLSLVLLNNYAKLNAKKA